MPGRVFFVIAAQVPHIPNLSIDPHLHTVVKFLPFPPPIFFLPQEFLLHIAHLLFKVVLFLGLIGRRGPALVH